MAYNNYYYPQPPQQPKPPLLKGRPVSSIEEVKACPIDFDGSVFFFPNLAEGKIYTKQINLDGTSSLALYEKKEIPMTGFITREEFEQALSQIHKLLEKPAASAPAPTPMNF